MDTFFFVASKLVWAIIRPESWILLALVLVLLFLWRARVRAAKRTIGAVLLALLLLGFVPLGDYVLAPLERRFAANPALERVDGIIVLAGSELAVLSRHWDRPTTGSAAERILAGIELANRFPEARLIYSGSSSSLLNQKDKATTVASMILASAGIAPERVQYESQSRNTAESVRLTKEMAAPKEGEIWLLVTSAFHMPRSVGIFCAQGWPVMPFPVDHRSGATAERIRWSLAVHLDDLNIGVREWVGLAAYRATGRTQTLLPDHCDERL